MRCDKKDVESRRDAKGRYHAPFDGTEPYDSPIVYWSRRALRRLDALLPWNQFVYVCSKWAPPWMGRRRARYYAEDSYVLLMTVFVTLWAFLTIGLTRPSSWQETELAWFLLVPGGLLIPLYVLPCTHWRPVLGACVCLLVAAFIFPAVFGLGSWVRWAVPWPLFLRALEILLTVARFINFDALRGGYRHTPISRIRYLYYIMLYFIQIYFIYAGIYAFWTPGGFRGPSGAVTGLNEYMYLSFATVTTLGSGFQPSNGLGQWLQTSEVAVGILLLAVGLAAFIGGIRLTSLEEDAGSRSGGLEEAARR